MLVLAVFAAGPRCETRGPQPDGGLDSGRPRDGGTVGQDDGGRGDPDRYDGGWDSTLPDGGFPGSGRNFDPGTSVLFLVRMDRGLANDAPLYQQLVDQVRAALGAAGLIVIETAVASQQDGQLLWAEKRGAVPPVALAEALTYYAERLPDRSAPCSTTGLAAIGTNVSLAVLSYPEDLAGLPYAERPFSVRPGAFLVVLVDPDLRPAVPASTACATSGVSPEVWFGGGDPAAWLSWRLPRPQTRFWAISTPEDGTGAGALRSSCTAAGFPVTALDVIGPSAVSFYDPWAAGMNASFPRLVERADFCGALTGAFPAQDFATAWARVLRAQAGLP